MDQTPKHVAALLGVSPVTLRKWSVEFADLLSPSAADAPGRAGRRYSESDIATLRHIAALLDQKLTYTQARERLVGHATAAQDAPEDTARPIIGDVTVIEPSDQQQALAMLLQAQSDLITRQQQHIADQAQMIDAQRQQVEALERGISAAHQETANTRADLVGQLETTRARLARVPRWLRTLFGATED